MDTHGHEDIAKVGADLLEDAFKKLIPPPYRKKSVLAFHLGNWLTDLEQIYDDVAFAKPVGFIERAVKAAHDVVDRGLARCILEKHDQIGNLRWWEKLKVAANDAAADRINPVVEKIRDAVNDFYNEVRDFIEVYFGAPGEQGKLAEAIKCLIRVAAYMKFAHPRDKEMNFESFLNVFDQLMDEKKSRHGMRGTYFPHHHLDRWPPDEKPAVPDQTRNKSRPETLEPGIYPYMRDHVEYISGLLAQLDLEWASTTFAERSFRGRKLPNEEHWSEQDWNDWEKDMDERMALLGHAVHAIEDFFAHSTFVEHALRLWANPSSKHLMNHFLDFVSGTLGKKAGDTLRKVRGFDPSAGGAPGTAATVIKDKDFTRLNRRLLRLDPARLDDKEWLNSTPLDGGRPVEDSNVVTGYYDFMDTLISVEHVAMEAFGHDVIDFAINRAIKPGEKPPGGKEPLEIEIGTGRVEEPGRYIRIAFEMATNPKRALIDFKNKISDATKGKLEEAAKDFSNLKDGGYWKINDSTADAIVGEILPEGTPREIVESFIKALVFLSAGKKSYGYAKSFYEAATFIATLFKGWAGVTKLVTEFVVSKTASVIISAQITRLEDGLKEFIGSMRIGCHSLLAKDHDYDVGSTKALDCAKAVHYYVVKTLLRWQDYSVDGAVSKVQPEGNTTGSSAGRNTFNYSPWIDWTELLEFFLRHPGGKRSGVPPVIIYETIPHIVAEGDSLATLGLYYRDTAVEPDRFTWKTIAEYNYGTSVPKLINAHLKDSSTGYLVSDGVNYAWNNGTLIWIPDQARLFYPLEVEDFGDEWYKHVIEDGWEAIKGWEDEKRGISVDRPHVPVTIKRSQVENIRDRGLKIRDDYIMRYRADALLPRPPRF